MKEIITKRHPTHFARSLLNLPDCYSRESRKRQTKHDQAVSAALRRREELADGRSKEETADAQVQEMQRICGKSIRLMGIRLDGYVIARIDDLEIGRPRQETISKLRNAGYKFCPWTGERGKTIRGWSKNNLDEPKQREKHEEEDTGDAHRNAGQPDRRVPGNPPKLYDGGFHSRFQ